MDGPDGGVDGHGGGFDGLSDGHGHGHAGGHTDFDHHSHHGGAHSSSHDHGTGLGRTKRAEILKLDSDTITESLLLSYDHCTVYPPGSACRVGGYNIVDANLGGFARDRTRDGKERVGARPLTPEQIEIVRKLADDPKRRSFGLHVVNHGYHDVAATFAALATAMNCKRIDSCTPNFFQLGSYSVLQDIADWNRYSPPFLRVRVPAGYYDGCTGTTTVWKQIWQVHKKNNRLLMSLLGYPPSRPQDKFNCPPDRHYNRDDNTIIEVFGVTWFYREAGDYETRFQINVISNPELDWSDVQWGYRKEPFERHQKAARVIAEQMLNKLKEATPHPAAVKLRGAIIAREEGERALVPVPRPVTPIVTPTTNEEGEPRIIIETPTPKSAANSGDATGSGVPKPTRVQIPMPGQRSAGDQSSRTGGSGTATATSTVAKDSTGAGDKTGQQCELGSGVDIFSVLGKEPGKK